MKFASLICLAPKKFSQNFVGRKMGKILGKKKPKNAKKNFFFRSRRFPPPSEEGEGFGEGPVGTKCRVGYMLHQNCPSAGLSSLRHPVFCPPGPLIPPFSDNFLPSSAFILAISNQTVVFGQIFSLSFPALFILCSIFPFKRKMKKKSFFLFSRRSSCFFFLYQLR